ncbi:MAG TPA: LamG-like jellyroll fold domain-containing protein [Saprospiraceae bacterium]|nr:LamG-like jellyroll fold domain-containing protein [Saprospiraceae bacterium]
MKKLRFLLLIATSLFTLFPITGFATNPEISKWIKNISEGEGAPAMGMDDYGPEMAVSGKVVHMLWMTNNNWVTRQLQYRRSPDGGKTWEAKKLLVDATGFDDAVRSPKMYVSGNYVHIAYVVKNGLVPSDLFYLRSTDGGQNFETPKILYSVPQNMTELRMKGDGYRITVAAIHNCWYCADVNILHLFNSENNGDTFEDRVVPGNFNAYSFLTWDVAVEAGNIYLMMLESVSGSYDYNLHVFSSNNRGLTFKDNIVSVPAMSGLHHPLALMDYNWGYKQKIATAANKAWVIWSGWNAENKERIFVSGSQDGGNSFSEAKEISGTLEGFQSGQESIVINGNEIYTCFLKADGKIYVAKSHNSGATFDPAYEYTLQDDVQLRSGWGPSLLSDPGNDNAYLFRTGPGYGVLTPGSDYPVQSFLGNATIRDQRYVVAAFDEDGMLHIAFQGGRAWLTTGVFTDYEIFYRRVDPNFKATTTEDHSLVLKAKQNPGDGTGENRFDKMIIAPDPELKFTGQMTIELWLKPEVDRPSTYITQNANLTWNQGQVGGFILWSDGYQGLLPVTNIITTSGLYPMSSNRKMHLNTWNHLAVTYDKDGGAQNFRLYLNGQLVASTTALGDIVSPDVMWMIGAFEDTYYRESFEGQMDELRFWNVAHTQEEIIQSQFEKLNGNEVGLAAYYNFNEISPEGQVEDITGKGHSGYLIYLEEVKSSTIRDIGVRFEYIQSGAEFFFTQKTIGGEIFDWSFGDTRTSTEVNPVHAYQTPGTFQVCLTASGNENSGTYCETLVVKGIDRVFPTSGGNTGGITLNIFGGGFAQNSQAILRLAGQTDITAFKNIFDASGSVTAVFDLTGQTLGDWDVVIKTGASELVLPKGFKIIAGEKAQPWVKYIGGGTLLVQRWTPQTIVVGNSANVDAYGVVLWVAVPNTPDFDILFLNLNVKKPQLAIDRGWSAKLDSLGLYSVVDTLFGKPSDSRLYSFYFPYLPAKSSFNISVRVRTKNPVRNDVQVAVSAPFYASPLSPYVQGCIAFAAIKVLVKGGIAFIPGAGCITGGLGLVSDYLDDGPPTPSSFELVDVRHFGWNIATALLECATSLGAPVISGILTIVTSSVEAKQEQEDCLKGFWPSPFSLVQIAFYGVTSLDPNEKKGPAGFAHENFIPVTGPLSYQVNFENKASATAPAQEVVVTDTLANPLFDLKNFSFGPVAFGDSIFYPISNAYEFGIETDLRPSRNILVRMEGQLDTLSRIVTWHFIALDPITRDLVTDPLGGFLPPNVTSPEGEGFVSLTVGLKNVQHMDAVSNKASIVFDLNPPIITNDFLNMFDMLAPQSHLTVDNPVSTDTTFTIYTEGTDDGSGIRLFEIYVSANNQPYELYSYTGSESFEFTGDDGNSYRFYSLAVDSVGNKETVPGQADIEVSIATGTKEIQEWEGVNIYPNPAGNSIFIEFTLAESMVVNCSLHDLNGRLVQTFFNKQLPSGFHQYEMSLEVLDGCYLMKLSSENRRGFKKIVVAQ